MKYVGRIVFDMELTLSFGKFCVKNAINLAKAAVYSRYKWRKMWKTIAKNRWKKNQWNHTLFNHFTFYLTTAITVFNAMSLCYTWWVLAIKPLEKDKSSRKIEKWNVTFCLVDLLSTTRIKWFKHSNTSHTLLSLRPSLIFLFCFKMRSITNAWIMACNAKKG